TSISCARRCAGSTSAPTASRFIRPCTSSLQGVAGPLSSGRDILVAALCVSQMLRRGNPSSKVLERTRLFAQEQPDQLGEPSIASYVHSRPDEAHFYALSPLRHRRGVMRPVNYPVGRDHYIAYGHHWAQKDVVTERALDHVNVHRTQIKKISVEL